MFPEHSSDCSEEWGLTARLMLHLQALCMHPILVAKVKAWAAESCGCFAVTEVCEQGGVKIEKYDGSTRFKWAKVMCTPKFILFVGADRDSKRSDSPVPEISRMMNA